MVNLKTSPAFSTPPKLRYCSSVLRNYKEIKDHLRCSMVITRFSVFSGIGMAWKRMLKPLQILLIQSNENVVLKL